jgi:hypothetical protein
MPSVFLCTENDMGVAARFLHAVSRNSETAWDFVSKIHAHSLDLNALHGLLGDPEITCKRMVQVPYAAERRNFSTHSVLLEDMEHNQLLLHLHMVKEPRGSWKIYGVEQE